jgi:hypothetical protein
MNLSSRHSEPAFAAHVTRARPAAASRHRCADGFAGKVIARHRSWRGSFFVFDFLGSGRWGISPRCMNSVFRQSHRIQNAPLVNISGKRKLGTTLSRCRIMNTGESLPPLSPFDARPSISRKNSATPISPGL